MPFSIGFGLGPVRYSHRLGGRRRRPNTGPPVNWAAELQRQRQIADDMTPDRLRTRHAVGWVFASLFALWMCVSSPVLIPVGVAALVITWRGHRARHHRRAQHARDALPPIDPAAELRFAREYGLPTAAWEDAITPPSMPVHRHAGTPVQPTNRGRHALADTKETNR